MADVIVAAEREHGDEMRSTSSGARSVHETRRRRVGSLSPTRRRRSAGGRRVASPGTLFVGNGGSSERLDRALELGSHDPEP